MTSINMKTLFLSGLVMIGAASPVLAEPNYHDVVRDMEGQIVHTSNGECVRTKWLNDYDMCMPQRVAQQTQITKKTETHVNVRPTQEERTVYFEFDRSFLSASAQSHLNTLLSVLKTDETIKSANIVGYADRMGKTSYNERLSQRRAETVRDYLVTNGYTNARVTKTVWVGESKPSTHCPVEARNQLIACLQNDRRVEIKIDFAQEKPTL